ncbi:E1A [Bat adenovirus 2]|uniref:E1A n=2 Tax=Mastadenovirus TaxID=10509 RepID=G1FQL5_9ADEN|nr:E1A [Bat adenovirus 2]AEM06262.1 E1A [Bat adenovirus 2]
MRFAAPSAVPELEGYVAALLEEWRPDCLCREDPPRSPSPVVTLHELFDISPPLSPVLCSDCQSPFGDSDTDSAAEEFSDSSDVVLCTPSVSPLPACEAPSPTITADMLLCLEEMPTFDDSDEVRSTTSSFDQWGSSLEPGVSVGCLRCAFYQEKGETSICGLCYLKALSEVPFAMPTRGGAVPAQEEESEDDVVFVSANIPKRKQHTPEDTPCSAAKRPCVRLEPAEAEQTEPLDLSTKPRPQ